MAVMRPARRLPLATLVPLLLFVGVLACACSTGTDVADGGPTVTATGPTSREQASGPTTSVPTQVPTRVPDAVAAVCGPYVELVRAIKNAAFSGAGPEEIAAAIAPRLKEFAARVPGLDRPPGISTATWRGVEALADRILSLPGRPTRAELEAVEEELSDQERDAFRDGAAWLREHCPL